MSEVAVRSARRPDLVACAAIHDEAVRSGVALPKPDSVALRSASGSEQLGTMREVGCRVDRWVDTAWFQRLVRPGAGLR